MGKLFKLAILVPVAVLLILLSVANRQTTTFSLDPTSDQSPAFAVDLPLFVLLFAAVILGALIGSTLTWIAQGKHRKALRQKTQETNQLEREKREAESSPPSSQQPEIAPGLPLISRS